MSLTTIRNFNLNVTRVRAGELVHVQVQNWFTSPHVRGLVSLTWKMAYCREKIARSARCKMVH